MKLKEAQMESLKIKEKEPQVSEKLFVEMKMMNEKNEKTVTLLTEMEKRYKLKIKQIEQDTQAISKTYQNKLQKAYAKTTKIVNSLYLIIHF